METIQTSRDALWKGIIEDLFDDFLRFFYPDDIDLIDFSKGFEFLDKELEALFPDAESRDRRADKLVKVHTKQGDTQWILIHIEVQGYYDKYFAERMFNYYYRILEKYKKKIAAIAIFTDDHEWFHPKAYNSSFFGTEVTYKFRTYKLSEKTLADFENSDNPFAVIMETAWYSLKKNKLDDEGLYNFKIQLIRRLMALEYTKPQIERIFDFIDYYVRFEKPEKKHKFEKEADIILQKRKPMGIREEILYDAKRQGIEEERERLTKKFEQQRKKIEQQQQQQLEQKFKTAIVNLREKGFTSREIADILGLSIEDISRLTAS